AQAGHPLDAHAEREARHLLGVVALDIAVQIGVDHPGTQDLDPALAPADAARRAVAGAVEAADVDLDGRLGEREEVRPQAHLALRAEDGPGKAEQRALEVAEGDAAVDDQAL